MTVRLPSLTLLTLAVSASLPGVAAAQDGGSAAQITAAEQACPDDAEYDEYGDPGTLELGGSLGFTWASDFYSISAVPSVGVFLLRYFELSAYVDFEFESAEDGESGRVDTTIVSFVVEPSYHYPLEENAFYLLGGLGVGVGYDGTTAGFDLVPRLGLNIIVTEHGVLTPSVRVPIILGVADDEVTGESRFDASAELEIDVGFTTYL